MGAQTHQTSSIDSLKRKRTQSVVAVTAIGVGTHALLYAAWYNKKDQTGFHFFNDNKQWLQMDKAGHAYSSFILSEVTRDYFHANGYSPKEAANLGLISSLAFQTTIEYFDGRNKKWGASLGDLGANFLEPSGLGVSNVYSGKLKFPFDSLPRFPIWQPKDPMFWAGPFLNDS